MGIKSPFHVLGLDVLALKDLSLDQLSTVVNKQYLAMMHLYHEDHTGKDGEKARALNSARDELADPKQLKLWLEEAKKSRGRQYWQAQLESASVLIARQQGFSLDLYQAVYKSGQQGNYVDLLGIGIRQVLLCHDANIGRIDSAMVGIGRDLKDEEETKKVRRAARQQMIDSHFSTLSIVGGRLQEKLPKDKVVDISNRLLVGRIAEQTIRQCFNGSNEPIYRFLTKICRLEQNDSGRARLPFRYGIRSETSEILTTLSWANFKRMLPFLSLDYIDEGYLFSMKIQADDIPIFRLEGKICKEKPQAGI